MPTFDESVCDAEREGHAAAKRPLHCLHPGGLWDVACCRCGLQLTIEEWAGQGATSCPGRAA